MVRSESGISAKLVVLINWPKSFTWHFMAILVKGSILTAAATAVEM
jgi:hypothetical protein